MDVSRLDDEEQYEWIRRWSTKQRRMQAEILQVRTAHRDGGNLMDPDASHNCTDPAQV